MEIETYQGYCKDCIYQNNCFDSKGDYDFCIDGMLENEIERIDAKLKRLKARKKYIQSKSNKTNFSV